MTFHMFENLFEKKNDNVESVLTVVLQANPAIIKKIKEDPAMCEPLRKLFAEEIKEEIAKAENNGMVEGIEKGIEKGLAALVRTLKPLCKTFDELYKMVVSNEEYKYCTEEQVRKYY